MNNYLINSFRFTPQITCASPLIDTTNLRAYYNLNGNANDTSGGGYNGTATNADILSGISGKFGGGAYFPDPNTNREIQISGTFGSLTVPLSFSFWTKFDSIDSSNRFSFRNVGNTNYNGIRFSTTYDSLDLEFGNNSGTGAPNRRSYRATGLNLSLNVWHHIVVTITNITTHKLYINGTEVSLPYRSGTLSTIGYGTGGSALGSATWGSKSFGFGYFIDDFSLWNVVLSQAQVTDLYNVNCPLI
jgi:trimeric autotransporter adhesin